ncbi:hypothetical protein CGCF413_v013065 [Colletotrichum fructicola]|nr:hypothetical protein CGCF413_v013065 [Colletotrichum fructicola]
MPARRLSKAALDDLIRETKANEIKGSEYGDLLYTDKKTKYLLETADKCEILKLHSLEVDVGMVEATDNDPDASPRRHQLTNVGLFLGELRGRAEDVVCLDELVQSHHANTRTIFTDNGATARRPRGPRAWRSLSASQNRWTC